MPTSVKGPEADELRDKQIREQFAAAHDMLDRSGVPRLIDGLGGHEYTLAERITILDPQAAVPPPDLDSEAAALSNAIYAAAAPLEDLERAGAVSGNGHHMRQEVAGFAVAMLRKRWRYPADAPNTERVA
jgi:hypothetical protein